MPVGSDGDQLVAGAAPELQDAPSRPIGLRPVEVRCGSAAGKHEVVELRVRVERFAHRIAPCRLLDLDQAATGKDRYTPTLTVSQVLLMSSHSWVRSSGRSTASETRCGSVSARRR